MMMDQMLMNGAGNAGGAYLPQAVPRPMATSLFQQCVTMIEKLYRFPLFDRYLFPSGVDHIVGPQSIDPVQILLDCFRLGAPLALLYNHLQPAVPIDVPDLSGYQYGNYQSREKKPVMKFLIAIKNELELSEEEKSTILSDLYADNTNQFVKFIRIVEKLIARIEQVGLLPPPRALPFELPSQSTESPSDNRSKLVAELIETERKYIEDLEFLQKYQNMLFDQNVLAKQKKYDIFCNLDAILDFQRRFLIMLEGTLALPPTEQRIGQVFVNTEEQFRVYEIYCANYDISVQHVTEEQETLMQLQSVMDPVIQLPSFLIKPVQRLLKYPLFLTDLIKFTDKASEAQQEDLKAGLDTVKRVGEHINEQKRRDENRHLKQDLVEKMEDWKNLNPDEFGELLLTDKFSMRTNDMDREYFIYLFERMLICCKDAGKKTRKSRGLTGGLSSSAQQPAMNVFQLRGNIDIRLVERVVDTSKPEQQAFGLKVLWRDGKEHETFVLKCRNMEQVKLWSERFRILLMERNGGRFGPQSAGVVGSDPMTPITPVRARPNTLTAPPYNESLPPYAQWSQTDDESDQPDYGEMGGYQRARSKSEVDQYGYPDGRGGAPGLQRSRSNPHSSQNYFPPPYNGGLGAPPMPPTPPQYRQSPQMQNGPGMPERGRESVRKGSIAGRTRGSSAGSSLRMDNQNPYGRALSTSPPAAGTRDRSPPPPMPPPTGPAQGLVSQSLGMQRVSVKYGPPPAAPPSGPLPPPPGVLWQSPHIAAQGGNPPASPGGVQIPNSGPQGYDYPSPPISGAGSPGRQARARRAPPQAYPGGTGYENYPNSSSPSGMPALSTWESRSSAATQQNGLMRAGSYSDVQSVNSNNASSLQRSGSYTDIPMGASRAQSIRVQAQPQASPVSVVSTTTTSSGPPSMPLPPAPSLPLPPLPVFPVDAPASAMRRKGSSASSHSVQQKANGEYFDRSPSPPPPVPNLPQTFSSGPPPTQPLPPLSSPPPNLPLPPTLPLPPPPPTDTTTPTSPPTPSAPSSTFIKLRTHYANEIFLIAVPYHGCSFADLYARIERKIRLFGGGGSNGFVMKYKDESGSLVRVDQDDDVWVALDVARAGTGSERGVLNVYVS